MGKNISSGGGAWWQAIKAVLGNSFRQERTSRYCQRNWILESHFCVHPANSNPVCSVPAAIKTTVYHNRISGFWMQFCSLLEKGLVSFLLYCLFKQKLLISHISFLISLFLLMLLESSHFNFTYILVGVHIYISICGCRRNWAVEPLGEYNIIRTQSKYFFLILDCLLVRFNVYAKAPPYISMVMISL